MLVGSKTGQTAWLSMGCTIWLNVSSTWATRKRSRNAWSHVHTKGAAGQSGPPSIPSRMRGRASARMPRRCSPTRSVELLRDLGLELGRAAGRRRQRGATDEAVDLGCRAVEGDLLVAAVAALDLHEL